jgi:hypothetical protein
MDEFEEIKKNANAKVQQLRKDDNFTDDALVNLEGDIAEKFDSLDESEADLLSIDEDSLNDVESELLDLDEDELDELDEDLDSDKLTVEDLDL